MNDKDKRDFEAGLAADVDAWLRGEPTRRSFITRLGQMTGMLAISGPLLASTSQWALAQAAAELADPSSPLGKAQAAALKASTEGPADGSAFRAVAGRQAVQAGVTLNMTYEAGLQALDPRNFSGPLWEQLTGIKSNVVELSHPDQYSKPVAEHIATSGAYDILDIEPAWTPVAGRWRRHRAARRLHRQIPQQGRPRRLPPALQGAADLQGQDLGLLRRRRHLRLLLSQGHLRGSEDEGGLPGQVRQGSRSAEDLGGLCAGRPVHHRPDGAERLRRRAFPQGRQPGQPV